MARPRKKITEFGSRCREVRERLSRHLRISDATSFAVWLGVNQNTYRPWELRDNVPGAGMLASAFLNAKDNIGRPICEAPRLVCWLATGEPYLEPLWLKDWNADPFAEPAVDSPHPGGPGGATASNVIPFELLRERVRPTLRKAAARELSSADRPDLELVKTATDFETWLRSVEPATPAASATTPSPDPRAQGSRWPSRTGPGVHRIADTGAA